jgi:hypothetical protein
MEIFSLSNNNKNQENPKNFKLTNFEEEKEISRPFVNPSKKKSRIVLDDLKLNTKDSKNYAMEFESLYDNYERDVDFVDKIDSQNSLNSEKELGGSLKKRSPMNPFGKKSSKRDTDKFSNEIDEFFAEDNNSLNFKRKSSILSILESNSHNKKNFLV